MDDVIGCKNASLGGCSPSLSSFISERTVAERSRRGRVCSVAVSS